VQGGDGNDTITAGTVGSLIDGGNGADSITGSTAADTITGGAGDDIIVGHGGADVLSGGGGSDTFKFAAADSLVSAGANGIVSITDWNNTDSLQFTGGGGAVGTGVGFYHNDTLTASNFSAAMTTADTQINSAHGGTDKYAAVQVGANVIIFVDTTGDHHITSADEAIILTGRSLTDVLATDFI
jgi:Ca2+-binding RTX toxin-like protein